MNKTFINTALTAALLSFIGSGSLVLAQAAGESNTDVQACASCAAGEPDNDLAIDNLLANIEKYKLSIGNKGAYESNLEARLGAIKSIWSLGEIGNPRVMNKLGEFYNDSDDVMKINLIISIGKLKAGTRSGAYLKYIASSAGETAVVRAAAFEMLEEMGQSAVMPDIVQSETDGIEKGDIIYTGGLAGTISGWINPGLPIGHAGIFAGTEVRGGRIYVIIADCVPDSFKPGGVRNIKSWKSFTSDFKHPYYGNRTTRPGPTAAQRARIVRQALMMGKMGLHYDNAHTSQKGPLVFDCVGYTEYLYERAGLNPTDNSQETGWGWPLTPWKQFDATFPNTSPVAVAIPVAKPPVMTQALSPVVYRDLNGLMSAFGINDMAQPCAIGADIQPARAD